MSEFNIAESEKIKNDILLVVGELGTRPFEKVLALKSIASDIENLLLVKQQMLSHKAIVANLMNIIGGNKE